MATLQDLLASRLECFSITADGWQARCPACAARGGDKTGNHLRIWRDGAFCCAVTRGEDKGEDGVSVHNRAIRAHIYQNADAEMLAMLEVQVIDPEPKLKADPVYPESMLSRMLPDYSYWKGRGISEEVQRRYEGGLVPALPRNKLSGRFVFPVRDHVSKRIMGWTGRLVSDDSFGPKHKHLVKSSRAVFPLTANEQAIRRARKVVLLEGVGDLLACAQAGIDYTLVLLGLNLNSRMLGFLVSANLDELVISTNSDDGKVNPSTGQLYYPGQEAAAKLRDRLIPYLGEKVVRIRLPQTRKDWCKTLEDNTGELEVFRAELEGGAPQETFTL